MNTGIFATIPLTQCVASAKMQLRIGDTTDDDLWMEKLANEATRHLDCLSIFTKRQCSLDVHDGKSKLPNGFYRLLGLRLGNGFDCGQMFYVDMPFLNSCGCVDVGLGVNFRNAVGAFQIQNGYIIYSTNMTFTDPITHVVTAVTSVDLAFIGLNVDSDGLMVVRDDMERGVTAYICWMYCLQNADKYNSYQIEKWEQIWKAQKMWIQSVDLQNQFMNTRRQIAQISNAWVVDKTFFT